VPRIEVRRTTSTEPPLFPRDANVVAVAADCAVEGAAERGLAVLELNDPAAIVDYIVARLELS
jgi:molybdopterin-guanine dinucleotide biosynthesis protein